jgi:hypothetical protein
MSSADNLVEPENLIAAALDAAEEIRDALDGHCHVAVGLAVSDLQP